MCDMSAPAEQPPQPSQTSEAPPHNRLLDRALGIGAYIAAGALALFIPGELSDGEVGTAISLGVGSLVLTALGLSLRHEANAQDQAPASHQPRTTSN